MNTNKHHKPKNDFWEIFKDKNGYFNLREITSGIFTVMLIIGWVAQQFFGMHFPEYMFYGFISLIASGGFGYSIERKQRIRNELTDDFNPNERNI